VSGIYGYDGGVLYIGQFCTGVVLVNTSFSNITVNVCLFFFFLILFGFILPVSFHLSLRGTVEAYFTMLPSHLTSVAAFFQNVCH
jgi:hypothetical protein